MSDLNASTLANLSRPSRSAAFASSVAAPAMGTKAKYALFDEGAISAGANFNSFDDGNVDLLMTGGAGTEADNNIAYDQLVLVASVSALPADIGREMVFSRKNNNLKIQYSSQSQDVSGSAPVGNHDLVKSASLALTTSIKQALVAEFDTLFRHGDEHFYGNSDATSSRNVAHVFMPSDFVNGTAHQDVINRTITTSMRIFLKRFPGQTGDTLSDFVSELKGSKDVMLRYSTDLKKPTSAVTMWYNAMLDANGNHLHAPLKETTPGLASMPKDVYDKCHAIAQTEINKYISLGDMTSENFAIRIKPFATNGNETLGLCDFAYHHPGLDAKTMVADPVTGNLITAQSLFDKTPIFASLRFAGWYKKVNTGSNF